MLTAFIHFSQNYRRCFYIVVYTEYNEIGKDSFLLGLVLKLPGSYSILIVR